MGRDREKKERKKERLIVLIKEQIQINTPQTEEERGKERRRGGEGERGKDTVVIAKKAEFGPIPPAESELATGKDPI